jgi:hypothetical protein
MTRSIMQTRDAMARMAGAALLVAAPALVGCGGGSGGGVVPGLCLTFQAAGTPAASTVVARQGSGSACAMVEVAVDMTGVNDVFTVSFQVAFDPAVVSYEGYSTAGSDLDADGATLQVLETSGSGSVTLGVTRVGTTSGINFSGTGNVIKLLFSPVQDTVPDSGVFDFSNTQVLGSETPPQEKIGIQWFDGTLIVS